MSDAVNNIVKGVQDGAAAVVQTGQDTLNYISSSLGANTAEAKAKADKETIKSDQTTLGQKVDGIGSYVSNKADEHSNRAEAEAYNQKLQNK